MPALVGSSKRMRSWDAQALKSFSLIKSPSFLLLSLLFFSFLKLSYTRSYHIVPSVRIQDILGLLSFDFTSGPPSNLNQKHASEKGTLAEQP